MKSYYKIKVWPTEQYVYGKEFCIGNKILKEAVFLSLSIWPFLEKKILLNTYMNPKVYCVKVCIMYTYI